jgi:hypothetical protein
MAFEHQLRRATGSLETNHGKPDTAHVQRDFLCTSALYLFASFSDG